MNVSPLEYIYESILFENSILTLLSNQLGIDQNTLQTYQQTLKQYIQKYGEVEGVKQFAIQNLKINGKDLQQALQQLQQNESYIHEMFGAGNTWFDKFANWLRTPNGKKTAAVSKAIPTLLGLATGLGISMSTLNASAADIVQGEQQYTTTGSFNIGSEEEPIGQELDTIGSVDYQGNYEEILADMGLAPGGTANFWDVAKSWYSKNTNLTEDEIVEFIEQKIEAASKGNPNFADISRDGKIEIARSEDWENERGLSTKDLRTLGSAKGNKIYINPHITFRSAADVEQVVLHELLHGHQDIGGFLTPTQQKEDLLSGEMTNIVQGTGLFGQAGTTAFDNMASLNAESEIFDIKLDILDYFKSNADKFGFNNRDISIINDYIFNIIDEYGQNTRSSQIFDNNPLGSKQDFVDNIARNINKAYEGFSNRRPPENLEQKIERIYDVLNSSDELRDITHLTKKIGDGYYTRYVGQAGELDPRLAEVQRAAIRIFGRDGIIQPGDVERGTEMLEWFLDPENEDLNGPDKSTARQLRGYINRLPEDKKEEIIQKLGNRVSELAQNINPQQILQQQQQQMMAMSPSFKQFYQGGLGGGWQGYS